MGEPIRLWDKYGQPHTMHSPSIANAMVVAGILFEQPPTQPVPHVHPEYPGSQYTVVDEANASATEYYDSTGSTPTPNDTQDVPVVRKPRKPKGDGGVL